MNLKNIIKLTGIICIIFIGIALFIIRNSPAAKYEVSIYTGTPLIFWIAVIINLIAGISIIMFTFTAKSEFMRSSNIYVIGLLLVFIVFASILSLWIIRGYSLWCYGDPLTHIGETNKIIASGHAESRYVYPGVHVYGAVYSEITALSSEISSKYIPLIFGLLSPLFSFCLAKTVLPERGQIAFTVIISMSFVYGWYLNFTPNHLSNLLFLVILFIVMRFNYFKEFKWITTLIIWVFLLPMFHPIIGFVFIGIMISIFLAQKPWNYKFKDNIGVKNNIVASYALPVLAIIWVITWVSSFGVWDLTIQNLHTLIKESGSNALGSLIDQIDYASSYNYSVIEMFFKTYGHNLIVIVLTVISLIIMWKHKRKAKTGQRILLFTWPLVMLVFAFGVLYLVNLPFGPERLMIYIMMMCAIFSGYILYYLIVKVRNSILSYQKLSTLAFIFLMLILLFTFSITTFFPSPYKHGSNWQITQSELSGIEWFFNSKDQGKTYTSFISLFRYAHLLLTPEEISGRNDNLFANTIPENLKLPYHFGYDNNLTLGDSYQQEVYVIFREQDRVFYQDVLPGMAKYRYEPADFPKLEQDSTLVRIYSNSGVDAYLIYIY